MLFHGGHDLLLPRATRRLRAERQILAITAVQRLPLPHQSQVNWRRRSLERRYVTAAVAGPTYAVFALSGRANTILQGEVFAQIAAHVLAPSDKRAALFTDHQNTIPPRYLRAPARTFRLRKMNARSYYRWLVDLTRRHAPAGLETQYTRGHADDDFSVL